MLLVPKSISLPLEFQKNVPPVISWPLHANPCFWGKYQGEFYQHWLHLFFSSNITIRVGSPFSGKSSISSRSIYYLFLRTPDENQPAKTCQAITGPWTFASHTCGGAQVRLPTKLQMPPSTQLLILLKRAQWNNAMSVNPSVYWKALKAPFWFQDT